MSVDKIGRRTLIAASLALGVLVAPGLGSAQQKNAAERKNGQEVYLNLGDEPPSMDPTKQVDAVSGFWLSHIFEGLMMQDKQGAIVPGAAEKMSVSADGKVYTFAIRKDAKWHDGKPVTAKDFEFAFRRLVDPAYASEYSFIAETAQIVNATEIIQKKLPVDQLGAKAVNDSTFEVTLKNPVTFFPALMSFQSFFPVRKDLVDKSGDKYATDVASLVGNGPYKLVRWQKEANMRIEKSDNYWNAKAVKIKAIESPVILKDNGATFNLFRTGGLDFAGLDQERLRLASQNKLPVRSFTEGTVFYIQPNQRQGRVFANEKLRQAIKFGISRSEFVNKIDAIPGSKMAYGLVPDALPGSKPGSSYRREVPMTWKDNDPAKAKALVKEALAEIKQPKVPSFTILTGDSNTAKRDAEYFQATLSRLFETEVKVDSVPFKTRLQKMRDGDFDIVLAGWGPDYLDAMTFIDLVATNNPNNAGAFSDAKYDELVKKAQVTADAAERVKIMGEAEKLLMEKAGVIPYHQRGRAYLLQPGLNGVIRRVVGGDPDLRFASWSTGSEKKN